MSEANEALDTCCASCGIAEMDDIKLVPCDGCDLVRYCGDECKNNHKPEHEDDCKKRVDELRDELLVKQPECSHLGDCPICSLPLSLDRSKSSKMGCCSKLICIGCFHANTQREKKMGIRQSCPFCREPLPENDEEYGKLMKKRIEANDPFALHSYGVRQYNKGRYSSAFKLYAKAAELGHAEAHYRLANMYMQGRGVEKGTGKEKHHLEEAAISGQPDARYQLGLFEWYHDNKEKAVKHWIIAATQGDDNSIKKLMFIFKGGFVRKEELAAALRAHKAAVDATKSAQRKVAEAFYNE